jgi:hypothetical protein
MDAYLVIARYHSCDVPVSLHATAQEAAQVAQALEKREVDVPHAALSMLALCGTGQGERTAAILKFEGGVFVERFRAWDLRGHEPAVPEAVAQPAEPIERMEALRAMETQPEPVATPEPEPAVEVPSPPRRRGRPPKRQPEPATT